MTSFFLSRACVAQRGRDQDAPDVVDVALDGSRYVHPLQLLDRPIELRQSPQPHLERRPLAGRVSNQARVERARDQPMRRLPRGGKRIAIARRDEVRAPSASIVCSYRPRFIPTRPSPLGTVGQEEVARKYFLPRFPTSHGLDSALWGGARSVNIILGVRVPWTWTDGQVGVFCLGPRPATVTPARVEDLRRRGG